MTRPHARTPRWTAAAVTIMIVIGVQLISATPAAAVSPLLLKVAQSSDSALSSQKDAIARCDIGWVVVGGGAYVDDGGRRLVRLTAMVPGYNHYIAIAEAPALTQTFEWFLTAYAICARFNDFDEYIGALAAHVQNPTSKTFVSAAAACPAGTVAYGSGASVRSSADPTTAGGRLGLQLVRTTGPMDAARATAREGEGTSGFFGPWQLTVYAICASPQDNIHVEGEGANNVVLASACDFPGQLHGLGGGSSAPGITDAGPVWLQRVSPTTDLTTVFVGMTGIGTGGVIAHHTCANGP